MQALSIVAAVATAVQAVALIMLHLLPTGDDPVRDAVSDYGVGPYRGWFWLQAVAGGVGCLALGIALAQLHPFTPAQVVAALIVTAGARFLIPVYKALEPGKEAETAAWVDQAAARAEIESCRERLALAEGQLGGCSTGRLARVRSRGQISAAAGLTLSK